VLDLKQLKARRERLGLTLQQAAKRAGFRHRQQWYEIETGRAGEVRMSTLDKLAEALECSAKDLVT